MSAVPFVELNINSAVSDATGMSPNAIVFGRDIDLPVDKLDGLHSNEAA